jgi:hypothetical protein
VRVRALGGVRDLREGLGEVGREDRVETERRRASLFVFSLGEKQKQKKNKKKTKKTRRKG